MLILIRIQFHKTKERKEGKIIHSQITYVHSSHSMMMKKKKDRKVVRLDNERYVRIGSGGHSYENKKNG